MSYQEKRTILSMVTGVPVIVAYCIWAALKWQTGGEAIGSDLRFWASGMLVFIAIGVGVAIMGQIVFHVVIAAGGEIKRRVSEEIAKELSQKAPGAALPKTVVAEEPCGEIETEDEMDRLINLKASRAVVITAGAGFLAGLVTLAVGLPPAVMLNIGFLALGIGSLLEAVAQLRYYRSGV